MWVSVFGYGSLMTPESALKTMPNAVHHRCGTLMGYERIFSLVSVARIKAGLVNWDTKEVAALAVRPASDPSSAFVKGCIFDIPENELEAFKEREHRYKVVPLEVIDHDLFSETGMHTTLCYVAVEQSNEDYRRSMSNPAEYETRVGLYYPLEHREGILPQACGELWGRTDIKPLRSYLVACVRAAICMDNEQPVDTHTRQISHPDTLRSAVANFLDNCRLADGTTVRDYMLTHHERFPEQDIREVISLKHSAHVWS